jgi:hypothetical protein
MASFFTLSEHQRLLSRLDDYYNYYHENADISPPPPSDGIINDTLSLSVEEFLSFLKKPRHSLQQLPTTANDQEKAYQRATHHIEFLKVVRNKAIVDHLRCLYQEISLDKDCPAIVFAKKLKYLEVEINKLAQNEDLQSFKARQEEYKIAHRLEQEKLRRLTLKDALQSLQIFVLKRVQDLEQQKGRHGGSADLHRNVELYTNLRHSLEAIAGDIRNAPRNTLTIVESSQYRTKETRKNHAMNWNYITKDNMDVASSAQSSKESSITSDKKPKASFTFTGESMAINSGSNNDKHDEHLTTSRKSTSSTAPLFSSRSLSTSSSSSSSMSRKRRRFIPFSQEQFDMVGKVINIHDGFSHIFAVHEESKVESKEKDNEEGECVTENYTGPDATQNSASLHALSASDAAVLQDANAGIEYELKNQQIDILVERGQKSDDERPVQQHSHATTRLLSSSPISIPSSSSTSLSAVTLPANEELRQNLKDPQCYDDQLPQSGQQKIIVSDSVNRGTSYDDEEQIGNVTDEMDQNRNITACRISCSSPISIHSSPSHISIMSSPSSSVSTNFLP